MAIQKFFNFNRKKEKNGEPLVEDSFISLLLKIKTGDIQLRNNFIFEHKPYILKVVSHVTGKYIDDENDDEYGIGLEAFNEAIECFDINRKSNFFEFAEVVIKRRVIDYIRRHKNGSKVFLFSSIEHDEKFEERYLISNSHLKYEEIEIKEDIESLKKEFSEYGINMVDLALHSPKHDDSRQMCIKIARTLADSEELFGKLKRNKNIPRNELMEKVGVHRRTIENNRKYIIAVSLILRSNLEISKGFFKAVEKGVMQHD